MREVDVDDEVSIGDVVVRATPAEHGSERLTLRSTPSLGYVISGSRTVYFAGDTDLFEGMSALADTLDVALATRGRLGAEGRTGPPRPAPGRAGSPPAPTSDRGADPLGNAFAVPSEHVELIHLKSSGATPRSWHPMSTSASSSPERR